MHPYSAIHVVQIGRVLDERRLRARINATLARRGLTRLRLDRKRFGFRYESGPAECDIRTIDSAEEPLGVLTSEMERQLNLGFPWMDSFSPFRFLILPAGDSFFLGIVYFHPAADAESVVHLLKDIVTADAGQDASATSEPPDLYPASGTHLSRCHPLVLARKILSLPAQLRHLRQSHRPRQGDANNLNNGFALFSLRPEDLRSLVARAKLWGVTLNDLFIALLMKSLSPCAVGRERARQRRKLSIGCIVNIRRDLDGDSARAFGVFLGSFTVTHEAPDGISLRELSAGIRQETSRIKRHRLYLGAPLELGFGRFMMRFFSPARRRKLYVKHYPLWGGITNMNLNSIWKQEEGGGMRDYFRGVSTGPITPLVLSVTTVGDKVNMGLSYRATVFSRSDIDSLRGRFLESAEEARRDA